MGKYINKYSDDDRLADQACVLFFLHGAERMNEMINGRQARDAFDAACRLSGRNPERTREHLDGFESEGKNG